MTNTIPPGLCQCGCGTATAIASRTRSADGIIKGTPLRFIKGHIRRLDERTPDYVIDAITLCWVWQRYITPDGYGRIHLRSLQRNVLAHRLYYERHVGAIPDGLDIDHLCRNRACVNPDHLEPCRRCENVMRGNGAAAIAARGGMVDATERGTRATPTHCKWGHRFSDENTYIRPNGSRTCRTCHRARTRKAAPR